MQFVSKYFPEELSPNNTALYSIVILIHIRIHVYA